MIDPFFLSFTPSAGKLSKRACAVLSEPVVSHRSAAFEACVVDVSEQLTRLSRASHLQPILATGSGTLANDVMLATYAGSARRPLVLQNGEFGQRLAKQCRCHNANTVVVDFGWGNPYDLNRVRTELTTGVDFLCMVATETSSGMMNPLPDIAALARERGIRIALDAVSALGAYPLNLDDDVFACITATSGKALAGLPGVMILLAEPRLPEAPVVSPSLSLAYYQAGRELPGRVAGTLSWTLLRVLHCSLSDMLASETEHYARLRSLKRSVIDAFRRLGLHEISGSDSPVVTTFHAPDGWNDLSSRLLMEGIEVYDRIGHLQARDLFQVATMGDFTENDMQRLSRATAAMLETSGMS